MNQTVVAVFGSRTVAQQAVDVLAQEGFTRDAMELTDQQPGTAGPGSAGTASAAPGGDDAPNAYCVLRVNVEDEASSGRAARLLRDAGAALDVAERQSGQPGGGDAGGASGYTGRAEITSVSPGMYTPNEAAPAGTVLDTGPTTRTPPGGDSRRG